jgi:hypothetical protein
MQASKKWYTVSCETEVGEYSYLRVPKGSLSHLEFKTDNEMNDHVFLDGVVNDSCDEGNVNYGKLLWTKGKFHEQCWFWRGCETKQNKV